MTMRYCIDCKCNYCDKIGLKSYQEARSEWRQLKYEVRQLLQAKMSTQIRIHDKVVNICTYYVMYVALRHGKTIAMVKPIRS